MPSIHLRDVEGFPVDLTRVSLDWAAIYLYPGIPATLATRDGPAQDAAQHRVYCARKARFRELGVEPVGVSSQSQQEQCDTIEEHGINHLMLIDPDLALAEALGLPTFELASRRWYQRVTLLTREGTIEWASVANGGNSPAQVLTWLQLHG